MISDVANSLTALFTGGALFLAYLAFMAQKNSTRPAFFVTVLPYDNAVSLSVTVRNRSDHPMRVVSLTSLTEGVKLANWTSLGEAYVVSIEPPARVLPIDIPLASHGQDENDRREVFDGINVGDPKLPEVIKLQLAYDELGDGRIRRLTRKVPLSDEVRSLELPNQPPTIQED